MAIVLNLNPEIESLLAEKARIEGVSIETLLESTVEEMFSTMNGPQVPGATQKKSKKFLEWAQRHRSSVPPLSEEAVSREQIYRDRIDAQR